MWLNGWRFVVQLFYVSAVWVVLSRLEGRIEIIIVTLAGILYVTIRHGFINQAWVSMTLGAALPQEFDRVKKLIDPEFDFYVEGHQYRLDELAAGKAEMHFHFVGLSLIFLVCLAKLLLVLF